MKEIKDDVNTWRDIPILELEESMYQNHSSKKHMYPNVHCSTIHNNQDMEAILMSPDRRMDKEVVLSTCTEKVVKEHKDLASTEHTCTTICWVINWFINQAST